MMTLTNPLYLRLDTALWKHPREVCMSYWQHFRLSMEFARRFLVAAVCAVFHAILPCLFKVHTSDTIRWANHRIRTAGCHPYTHSFRAVG